MFLTKASYNTEQRLEQFRRIIYPPRENIRYCLDSGKYIQCLMEYNGLKRELADIELLNKQKVIHQEESGKPNNPNEYLLLKLSQRFFKWNCGNQ